MDHRDRGSVSVTHRRHFAAGPGCREAYGLKKKNGAALFAGRIGPKWLRTGSRRARALTRLSRARLRRVATRSVRDR